MLLKDRPFNHDGVSHLAESRIFEFTSFVQLKEQLQFSLLLDRSLNLIK